MNEKDCVGTIKGVGPKTQKLFEKLGIDTVGDLLHYYPRTYEQFGEPVPLAEIEEGELVSVAGYIKKRPEINMKSPLKIVTAVLSEHGASLKMTWFRMPFLRTKLVPGSFFIYRGHIARKKGVLVMEQPKIYTPSEYEQLKHVLQPVYPLTAGITSNTIRKAVRQVLLDRGCKKEYFPAELRKKYKLAEYNFAIETMHFPKNMDELMFARNRFVFEEFFMFILILRRLREQTVNNKNAFQMKELPEIDEFIKRLPYTLTGAQKKVWEEIKADLKSERQMSRLVQGDVGSGKTILAVSALLMAVRNGYQGALMAPTEVLARQHYEDMKKFAQICPFSFRPVLLTGSMTAKEKRDVNERIALGMADVIIGTHALIQENVDYPNLALVVTDEQHRFGVRQREALAGKGREPHILVMSATPIPRTLAIIIYGDLDISVVDELPANRLPIKNCVVDTTYREKAYRFIEKEVDEGRQAYVICPMVEESENLEAENVMDYAQTLQQSLHSGIRIACLHGKMKQAQKDEIMEAFSRNQIQVLVSTTVIEVGINVPNASVMMVENAERFGLAQLHQLRGRVGRGKDQSYCIFVNGSKSSEKKERLEILNRSNDGFYIASEDLKLRGPGDLFGIRQSGLLDFKLADVYQDAQLLKQSQKAVSWAEEQLRRKPEERDEQFEEFRLYLEEYEKQRKKQLQI